MAQKCMRDDCDYEAVPGKSLCTVCQMWLDDTLVPRVQRLQTLIDRQREGMEWVPPSERPELERGLREMQDELREAKQEARGFGAAL